jgi:hypothetical protein
MARAFFYGSIDPYTFAMASLYIMYNGRFPESENDRKTAQRVIRELETYPQNKKQTALI